MKKELGKITDLEIKFQDDDPDLNLGIWFNLGGPSWGTSWWIPFHGDGIKMLMKDAKITKVLQLKNKPVEVIFKDNTMIDFRILTEVI